MIAVMNVPKMDEAPASAAAAAEAVPEHMGALSVGNDYGYGKVEDVREQHAKELQRDKKNDEAKAEAAAAKAPLGPPVGLLRQAALAALVRNSGALLLDVRGELGVGGAHCASGPAAPPQESQLLAVSLRPKKRLL